MVYVCTLVCMCVHPYHVSLCVPISSTPLNPLTFPPPFTLDRDEAQSQVNKQLASPGASSTLGGRRAGWVEKNWWCFTSCPRNLKTSVTKYRFGLFVTRGVWKRLAPVLPSKSDSLNLNSCRLLTAPHTLSALRVEQVPSCRELLVTVPSVCLCTKIQCVTACVWPMCSFLFATCAPRHPSPVTLLSKNTHPCPRKRANSCY